MAWHQPRTTSCCPILLNIYTRSRAVVKCLAEVKNTNIYSYCFQLDWAYPRVNMSDETLSTPGSPPTPPTTPTPPAYNLPIPITLIPTPFLGTSPYAQAATGNFPYYGSSLDILAHSFNICLIEQYSPCLLYTSPSPRD